MPTFKFNASGLIAGLLSAIFVCGYVTTNKYIYSQYDINAIDYTIFFTFVGGIFALSSLVKQVNKKTSIDIRKNYKSLTVLGIIGSLAVGVFVFGQNYTTGINAALLITATIATTSLFSYLLLGDRLLIKQLLWICVLFIGIYIGIVGFNTINIRSGDLIILLASLLFGFGNAYSRRIMKKMDRPDLVPDIRLFIGAVLSVPLGLIIIRDFSLFQPIFGLAILAGLFYWLCMKTFAKAVHLLNANEAIVLNNSQIFFTSIAGVFFLSESYSMEKFLGSAIALVSIYFITIRK